MHLVENWVATILLENLLNLALEEWTHSFKWKVIAARNKVNFKAIDISYQICFKNVCCFPPHSQSNLSYFERESCSISFTIPSCLPLSHYSPHIPKHSVGQGPNALPLTKIKNKYLYIFFKELNMKKIKALPSWNRPIGSENIILLLVDMLVEVLAF